MPIERSDLKVMDPDGTVEDPNNLVLTAQGKALAKFIAAVLCQFYPGWRWGVTVNERGGVISLFVLDLSGDLGYTVYLDDVWNGGNFDKRLVLMCGGEILERYGLPRTGKRDDWLAHVTFGPGGQPIPDVTDKTAGYMKHLLRRGHVNAQG